MMQSVETAPVKESYIVLPSQQVRQRKLGARDRRGHSSRGLRVLFKKVHTFLACGPCGLSTLWGILGQHCESVLEL